MLLTVDFFHTINTHLGTCSPNKKKRICSFTQLLAPSVTLFTDTILKQRQMEWYEVVQISKGQNVCCVFV